MTEPLSKSIQYIKGIGPAKAETLLNEAGLETIEDLLYYSPRKYLDRSSFKYIKDCFLNDVVTVAGTIRKVSLAGRKKKYLEVRVDDGTDSLTGIFFGGVYYFMKLFKEGDSVLFSGKVDYYRKKQIVHPDFDFVDDESQIKSIHTGRIVPLYRSTEKLKSRGFDSRGFRRIIRIAIDNYLESVNEPFNEGFLERLGLINIRDALYFLHYPGSTADIENARKRLAFNELFFLQYYLGISKKLAQQELLKKQESINKNFLNKFIEDLPFRLTGDQEKAIEEIAHDMENPFPMCRLLQGDVGCGKTVVAMAAAITASERMEQTAFMAPTEILVHQHYENFKNRLPPGVTIGLLTGSTPQSEKKEIRESIKEGELDIIIGTHALIQEDVQFKRLGLIIIDEQHRFGVNQRARLREKGSNPHLLIMTATPIPRSLALTLYGDLDVTAIREKPSNRIPVQTMIFPESRLQAVYNSVKKYMDQGRQVYFVLPLIEESEKLDLKSALETWKHLKEKAFTNREVAIIHGRLDADAKESIMKDFKNGAIDILVSTTVIEVGIDVPNATIMVIEHAERFGLSQLHQLRGRVGRGEHRSFCILIYPDDTSDESRKRIELLAEINDGFRIAEEDLKLRGSGEIIGLKQHGHNSGFEFTNLATDLSLVETARDEAKQEILKLGEDPDELKRFIEHERFESLYHGIRTRKILSLLS